MEVIEKGGRGGHKNRLEQYPLGAGNVGSGMRVVVSHVVGRVSLCVGETRS